MNTKLTQNIFDRSLLLGLPTSKTPPEATETVKNNISHIIVLKNTLPDLN